MNRSNSLHRVLVPLLFLGLSLLQGCVSLGPAGMETVLSPPAASSCPQGNYAVQDYFSLINNVKKQQPDVMQIMKKFPKGADLHNHLSGSVMPEEYIALGSAQGDCFGSDKTVPTMYTIVSPKDCTDGFKPLAQASAGERQQLLQSLSMYQFNDKGITSVQAGHDQFFATFGRFGAVSGPNNMTPMLAKLLQHAYGDSVSYVETMTSFQSTAVGNLADQLRTQYPDPASFSDNSNYPAMFNYLLGAGLKDAVVAAQKDVATYVNGVNAALKCGTATSDPACEVSFNFQAAVNRNSALKTDGSPDLPKIFTQVALSSMLADMEPKVVGVNLLSGEDSPVSMQSFTQQMQFFSYFHEQFPRVNIALHGGELTPCFVGADQAALKDHITGSIQAGAKRVGHAVSFTYLSDADKKAVAALMKQNNTLVEVPFTSNAQILGVAGVDHPFQQYFRKYGVPVAFSTDDEGVSYADYTSEWIYALFEYALSWPDMIELARASLQYSFLSGDSLWQDASFTRVVSQCAGETVGSANPGEPCKSFLAKNAKAGTQWRYEGKLVDFGNEYGAALRKRLGSIKEARR